MSRFKLKVATLDGKILEFPQEFWLDCAARPIGESIVRNYDKQECIVAKKVYLVQYGGHVFGTDLFSTMDGYFQYQRAACVQDEDCCYLTINGCRIFYDGKPIAHV